MGELRATMKKIFNSIDGLNEDMVVGPKEVVGTHYNVLVVDEAHRLYRRKHLPGGDLYVKFDDINKSLMGDAFSGTENDLTELDWIIKSSDLQILFYDKLQTIRTPDIDRERFERICRPHLYKYIELFSQMRCNGGNGYYEYVKKVLCSKRLKPQEYQTINNYRLIVVDSVEELFDKINRHNNENGLSRVVAGPGWAINDDIIIEDKEYHWAGDKKDWSNPEKLKETIFSIHKIQGFDLNYAGVIFGKEVFFDTEHGCIAVKKEELRDNHAKSAGEDAMRQFILNIYLTLMTRGINGTYIYAVDQELSAYLKQFFS